MKRVYLAIIGTWFVLAIAHSWAQEAPNVNEVIAKSNVEAGQLRLALGQMQEQTLAALRDADQTQDELQDELEK